MIDGAEDRNNTKIAVHSLLGFRMLSGVLPIQR